MEMQFHKNTCRYLKKAASQVRSQEFTQEIGLTEAMPDIGRTVGAWGQVVLRGKEWQGEQMVVSGGILAKALYIPDQGGECRTVDAWMPFQMKWDVPGAVGDGSLFVSPEIKSVDVRSTSARKLMFRGVVSVAVDALESAEAAVYTPGQMPEDVQLLKHTYPAELPLEAGEKSVRMDEPVQLPGNTSPVRKIISAMIHPSVSESRVMGSRLVFRGEGKLCLLYLCEDGQIMRQECTLPFSQYAELGADYSSNATARVLPVVTGLETEMGESGLFVKCGIACQYQIFDRVMLDIVEDAYSTVRNAVVTTEDCALPMLIDRSTQTVSVSGKSEIPAGTILDASWYHGHPRVVQLEDASCIELSGQFQVVYLDEDQALQCCAIRTQTSWNADGDNTSALDWDITMESFPDGILSGEGIVAQTQIGVEAFLYGSESIPMVTAVTLGETEAPDPGRPSLILKRAGDGGLWELAKNCRSTVDAIRKANKLDNEPLENQMLLIPVP